MALEVHRGLLALQITETARWMLLLHQGLRRRVINHHMAVITCLLLLEKKLLFTGIRRVCLAVLRGESQGFLVVRVWSFANHVKVIIGGRGALGE